jgi:6-phosphogluconate dehydrogenase
MHITYIGLGKMGRNMVERLLEKGHTVSAYDPLEDARYVAEKLGVTTFSSISSLLEHSTSPRTVWIMVPHTNVDSVLDELQPLLKKGDAIIEGGNSPYKETIRRSNEFESKGIHFLDAGVSGGPRGARNGACVMVGGKKETCVVYENLFKDIAVQDGYAYVGSAGAGHFVKMVHNGIEYGMMQALAEGFDILQHAEFEKPLPLLDIAKLYNHGSVIESRLVGWLLSGFEAYGEELESITGSARASGEGLWTVETAKEMNISTPVIENSVFVRDASQKKPSYQGQLLSVMRNQFGGHSTSQN